MRGWLGNTDFDWYTFLLAQPSLEEVNFWQPSGAHRFGAIPQGAPFFFKLKKPHYAIGGFGFFSSWHRLEASLAWDAFEHRNGAASFPEMRDRIARYRERPIGPHDDPEIGCILVQQPVFFERRDWVPQPEGWPKNAVTGKSYDLTESEGRRVWEQCQAAALRAGSKGQGTELFAAWSGERYGRAVEIRPRLGQGSFRVTVLDAYGRACAVTNEHSLPVLEAAHIKPYGEGGEHDPRNGLLLRSDLHRLFDKGFVTVTPDLRFRVSPLLRDRWRNGRTYYGLEGQRVRVPDDPTLRPDRKLLDWHEKSIFVA